MKNVNEKSHCFKMWIHVSRLSSYHFEVRFTPVFLHATVRLYHIWLEIQLPYEMHHTSSQALICFFSIHYLFSIFPCGMYTRVCKPASLLQRSPKPFSKVWPFSPSVNAMERRKMLNQWGPREGPHRIFSLSSNAIEMEKKMYEKWLANYEL